MGFLCWLIVGSEILLAHMIFSLDFLGIKDLKKIKKRPQIFLKALAKATDQFYRNFIIFLAYLDRFDIKIQLIEGI